MARHMRTLLPAEAIFSVRRYRIVMEVTAFFKLVVDETVCYSIFDDCIPTSDGSI
jgi:hypothetical protein